MKRHLPLAVLCVLAFTTFCFGQEATASPSPSPKPKPRMNKAQVLKKLQANETAMWNAWKNKDSKVFNAMLTADSIMIGGQGTAGKKDVAGAMSAMPCEVKSFTLSDWKVTMADSDAALLTYKGVADGTCAGKPIPNVWASSLWVNRKGKWMAFSHQETNVEGP
jgi:hypothetical protein